MNLPEKISRRTALQTLGAGAVALAVPQVRAATAAAPATATPQPFALPKLAYAYDALEPHIDARTMEIHHTKHHQAYITNANTALAGQPGLRNLSAEALVADLAKAPEAVRTALRNNVGGHLNHALFWETIGPGKGGAPGPALGAALSLSAGQAFLIFTAIALGLALPHVFGDADEVGDALTERYADDFRHTQRYGYRQRNANTHAVGNSY